MVCFVHFDLEMCFAPQRRALFRHLNWQKWSGAGVFCTFWLRNVLRATTACTFSTSQLPKVVREWCVLYILTWKCASRHNGVQFFISPLASWLRTRRFSEPTFRPSGATNHWKNTVNRDFPTFSSISIFFLLTLSLLLFSLLIFLFSLPLPCSAFHLSILSEAWLLNFLRSIYIYIQYALQLCMHHTSTVLRCFLWRIHRTARTALRHRAGFRSCMLPASCGPCSAPLLRQAQFAPLSFNSFTWNVVIGQACFRLDAWSCRVQSSQDREHADSLLKKFLTEGKKAGLILFQPLESNAYELD